MDHETKNPKPEIPPGQPKPPGSGKRKRKKRDQLTKEQREEIVKLHKQKFGTRKIAPKVGTSRRVVRDFLEEHGYLKKQQRRLTIEAAVRASKLDPFRQLIREKAKKQLTVSRILREIKAQGYTGGRTILADYVRTICTPPVPKKKVWRRFETRQGEETQVDWSPYRVPLGGRLRMVHAFAATLGHSRKSHVRFYPDERQSTLLEAHTHAFEDFQGVTQRVVYDRMSTVVLGTIGRDRKPIWHPRFLEFSRYYGFETFLCAVADPDRKGKDERVFWFLERDFIRGSEFDSLEEMNARVREWLDEVANCRVHGTTRRIPDEVWEQERAFLIKLPDLRFPACDEELRQVGPDSVVSIRGTPYTVPGELASQKVSVNLFAEYFEVLDRRGEVAFTREYVPESEKGRLVIDTSHYDGVRRRSPPAGWSTARLEDAFLDRFPSLSELVCGIKLRMKSLAHVHLRALWRLVERYGDEVFLDVAARVQAFRRFDSQAVKRILEREHPLPPEEPRTALCAESRVLMELGDVDPGSLDDYAHLDTQTPGSEPGKDLEKEKKGGDEHGPQKGKKDKKS